MTTKIILELGYNHQGKIDIAKNLIDEAAKLKVYGVKLQKWDIDNFPDHIKNIKRSLNNSFAKTYYDHRKYLEFSVEQLQQLKKYAEKKGLKFIVSGKDYNSMLQVLSLGCEYVKLPSQRYLDNDIFKMLYRERGIKNFKIMVSCGMNTDREIVKSRWIDCADVFYYCISQYPPEPKQMNLGFMRNLRWFVIGKFGYSSHEINGVYIPYAVAIGAEYVERHYTFYKGAKGTDHKLSSDFNEMKTLIETIEEVEEFVGDGTKELTEKELETRKFYGSF